MKWRIALAILFFDLLANRALGATLYNVEVKYEVEGGVGYMSSFLAFSKSTLIYSNMTLSDQGKFASIKLPLKGGSGCRKNVEKEENASINQLHSINSFCVKIKLESDNSYSITENIVSKFDDNSEFKNFAAYHFFLVGDACNVTMDSIWRTFKNIPNQQFQAKKLTSAKCQVPGPDFFPKGSSQ